MVKPAILSTILLVFGSSMGSYPVPHYLGLTTLATKYVSMNSKYTGEASILAIIMMIFGVAIMLLNQLSLQSRKNYTTVTGKSGQISKINLGRVGRYVIALVLVVVTFFTSIFPIVSFAFETFLPNPGDYSFLYTGDTKNLTTSPKTACTARRASCITRPSGMPSGGPSGSACAAPCWRAPSAPSSAMPCPKTGEVNGQTMSTAWPFCHI